MNGHESDNACGLGGAACTACLAGAQHCEGGQCAAACDPSLCPDGCCTGNTCVTTGQSDSQCGNNGGTCVNCGNGAHCVNGQCQAACDSTLCTVGCCSGTTCQPGTDNAMCGSSGGPCQNCGTTAECQGGVCVPACNSGMCPTGCCNGTTCEPGTSITYCGFDGAACSTCADSWAVCDPPSRSCQKTGACANSSGGCTDNVENVNCAGNGLCWYYAQSCTNANNFVLGKCICPVTNSCNSGWTAAECADWTLFGSYCWYGSGSFTPCESC
jgi:hypothetical protein